MSGIAGPGELQAAVAFGHADDPQPTRAWTPAWHCPAASHYLKWGHQPNGLGWYLTRNTGRHIGHLEGYPAGGATPTPEQAIAWANQLLGRDLTWTEQPPRSGAHHTHIDHGHCGH